MRTLSITKQGRIRNQVSFQNNNKPFYRQHLEDFLGDRYTTETYDSILDEVVEDVERRIKALIN